MSGNTSIDHVEGRFAQLRGELASMFDDTTEPAQMSPPDLAGRLRLSPVSVGNGSVNGAAHYQSYAPYAQSPSLNGSALMHQGGTGHSGMYGATSNTSTSGAAAANHNASSLPPYSGPGTGVPSLSAQIELQRQQLSLIRASARERAQGRPQSTPLWNTQRSSSPTHSVASSYATGHAVSHACPRETVVEYDNELAELDRKLARYRSGGSVACGDEEDAANGNGGGVAAIGEAPIGDSGVGAEGGGAREQRDDISVSSHRSVPSSVYPRGLRGDGAHGGPGYVSAYSDAGSLHNASRSWMGDVTAPQSNPGAMLPQHWAIDDAMQHTRGGATEDIGEGAVRRELSLSRAREAQLRSELARALQSERSALHDLGVTGPRVSELEKEVQELTTKLKQSEERLASAGGARVNVESTTAVSVAKLTSQLSLVTLERDDLNDELRELRRSAAASEVSLREELHDRESKISALQRALSGFYSAPRPTANLSSPNRAAVVAQSTIIPTSTPTAPVPAPAPAPVPTAEAPAVATAPAPAPTNTTAGAGGGGGGGGAAAAAADATTAPAGKKGPSAAMKKGFGALLRASKTGELEKVAATIPDDIE